MSLIIGVGLEMAEEVEKHHVVNVGPHGHDVEFHRNRQPAGDVVAVEAAGRLPVLQATATAALSA